MSELDFTKPAEPPQTSIYDPAMAMEFFSSAGKTETVAQGATLFAENEKASRLLLRRDKMYLILDGEVSLVAKNKVIGKIGKGEIFGEIASISEMLRSATAMSNHPCPIIVSYDIHNQSALSKKHRS